MANLFEQGAAWLADQLKTHASVQVVYQRGALQITVQATIGKTEFEIDNGSGIIQRFQSRDYLIQTADLKPGGIPTLPVAGDRIRETVGDQVLVYEVLAPGDEPHFRFSDPFRKLLRIHTKHVGTENV
jgi:hypothetical protein